MHVVRIKSRHTDRQGREREYESRLLRRTYRDGGKVRHETLANLSKMPDRIVDAVEAALKGEVLVPAGEAAVTIARSLPHGHVAAVHAMARKLGLPALLGPAGRQRDLALALIISRVVRAGLEAVHAGLVGRRDARRRPRHRGRHDRRGLRGDGLAGSPAGRDRGASSPAGTSPRTRTRPGWRCSTCRPRGWRARTARSGRAAAPATARRATCRSSTGCSPTPQGRPVAVRVLRGEHRRPRRVHRDRRRRARARSG